MRGHALIRQSTTRKRRKRRKGGICSTRFVCNGCRNSDVVFAVVTAADARGGAIRTVGHRGRGEGEDEEDTRVDTMSGR